MTHDTHADPSEYEHRADVSAERLARVYAEALLAAADSTGQGREVIDGVDSLVDDVLRSNPRLDALFGGAPGLLGGVKTGSGDQQIDATVRTKIDTIHSDIIARSSHEIKSRRDHFSTD